MRSYAESGYAEAQYYLGMMYDDCRGVEQDSVQAAQYSLGGMYEAGDGVPTDHVQAKKWYELAAKQGDEDAQRRLEELGEPVVKKALWDEAYGQYVAEVDDCEPGEKLESYVDVCEIRKSSK